MRSFRQIRSDFGNVRFAAADNEGDSGDLTLSGKETTARLLLRDHPQNYGSENGWFDIKLRSTDGRYFLLHNCVLRREGTYGNRRKNNFRWNCEIFPNFVLISDTEIENLRSFRKIIARFDGFERFFDYKIIEHIDFFEDKCDAETQEAVKVIRNNYANQIKDLARGYEYISHFEHPYKIIFAHVPEIPVLFRANRRSYEIQFGIQYDGYSTKAAHIRTDITASIEFEDLVSCDGAFDFCLEWRDFFVEMQASHIAISALAFTVDQADHSEEFVEAYMSNIDDDSNVSAPIDNTRIPIFYFMEWQKRQDLSDFMNRWILRSNAMEEFRRRVSLVASGDNFSLGDFSTLCAAIDALQFDKEQAEFTKDQINQISRAFEAAIDTINLDISRERIAGLVSGLNNKSFSNKLKLFIDSFHDIENQDREMIRKEVYALRNTLAHGKSTREMSLPMFSSIINILFAMCCEYDLRQSFGANSVSALTVTTQKLRDGVRELSYLKKNH